LNIDRRLIDIDQTDHEEPTHKYQAQLGVLADNLMSGYLKNPARTDTMLRRDGMTKTADRLTELFGAEWWKAL
jgi:long-subunit acyl-CoA synthetase (AMP-forming)